MHDGESSILVIDADVGYCYATAATLPTILPLHLHKEALLHVTRIGENWLFHARHTLKPASHLDKMLLIAACNPTLDTEEWNGSGQKTIGEERRLNGNSFGA